MQGSAYHFKALELANSTNVSVSQYAYRGCAGIARQLHPMKAGGSMNGSQTNIDLQGSAYHLKAFEPIGLTSLSGCQ